jgi:hypothetical protein
MQCSPPGTYRGALDVLKQLLQNEVGCVCRVVINAHTSLGRPCVVQRSNSTCSRLGCHRLSTPWFPPQLPPLPFTTRNGRSCSRQGYKTTNIDWTWNCRVVRWLDKVFMKFKLIEQGLTKITWIQCNYSNSLRTTERLVASICLLQVS